MNRIWILVKAAFLQLRMYVLSLLGYTAVSVLTDVVLNLTLGYGENSHISFGSTLVVLPVLIAIVLPLSFFKRIIHLGATRKEYYIGILMTYVIASMAVAVLYIVWMKVETIFSGMYGNHIIYLLEVFHWDQFGSAGMLVYQFGAYMLLISIFNLLFSGLRHKAGWVICGVIIAAIPIGSSLPSIRSLVADAFLKLLFNDSLLQGFGLTFFSSCLFLAGGWWFTKRRTL
ncbi:hypothetical protein [Paenibacillus hamazuiensis]|uniref:hypothetical protein n=1 Tax=Paenibacillus hamazuiensis TaxID=2936508 RepID=UPI00200BF2D1|nr:hypothetical protein [Paenibacillus hamazuiensis]